MDFVSDATFVGRLSEERLSANWFLSLDDRWSKNETWRTHYNETRTHSALGSLTLSDFARQHGLAHAESSSKELEIST